jgi:hypothetical protein
MLVVNTDRTAAIAAFMAGPAPACRLLSRCCPDTPSESRRDLQGKGHVGARRLGAGLLGLASLGGRLPRDRMMATSTPRTKLAQWARAIRNAFLIYVSSCNAARSSATCTVRAHPHYLRTVAALLLPSRASCDGFTSLRPASLRQAFTTASMPIVAGWVSLTTLCCWSLTYLNWQKTLETTVPTLVSGGSSLASCFCIETGWA